MIIIINYVLVVVGVLISVAFIVLFERKVLGYIQIRKGPNKVGIVGILQSFGDAIKLFTKEQSIPFNSNFLLYYFSPVASLFIIIFLWVVFPLNSGFISIFFAGLFFFCCTGFGVYTLMSRGWSSNRNYALLGALRGVAQTISYEVRLALIFISFIFILGSFTFIFFLKYQLFVINFFVFILLFMCWVGSSLAETNRTPFDFAEGESELVSGFNIEYGRGGFALLFLAEYGSIIFIRYLISLIFFWSGGLILWLMRFIGRFFCFWFIWVRGTLPRYRYDKLIYLAWKRFLPLRLNLIFFFFLFKLV